ncbi:MAG TPA: hypothetical protein VF266_13095 [Thermoanaerobaculia bacterium]
MIRRLLVALALSCAAFAADVPLAPSDAAPSARTLVVTVPHRDGFFTLSKMFSGGIYHYFGTRITAAGEVLDPGGVLLLSMPYESYRWEELHVEDGQAVWITTTGFPEMANDWTKLDWRMERRTLDLDRARVTGLETIIFPDWPVVTPTRNARGETLNITYGGTGPIVWFVGADGVRRKPTPLPAGGAIESVVPYGDDEWLILGNVQRGTVWYRISEAKRDTPQSMTVDRGISGAPITDSLRTVACANGEYAVLTEEIAPLQSSRYERTLALRVIRADGSTARYALLEKESLITARSPRAGTASLARDGDAWLVAHSWWDSTTLQQLRLWRIADGQPSDTKLDPYFHPRDMGVYGPQLRSGTTHNLLLSRRGRADSPFDYDYYVRTWERDTTPSPSQEPRLFATSVPPQATPSVLSNFAVWREGDQRGAAMLRVGNGAPRRLSSLPYDAQSPVLARNGDTFAAAWVEVLYDQDHDAIVQRIVMQRFDPQGNAIDAEPLIVDSSTSQPDTYRVAIGADADGFRVAWHGRSTVPLSTNVRPTQTIYTTHVGATIGKPEELVPPYIRAYDPMVIAHGAETLLLWREVEEIHGRRYTNGTQARPGSVVLTRGARYSAAARDGEVLIATVHTEQQRVCTDAQRFSFAGVALAPAVTVACTDGRLPVQSQYFATWDNGRWWIAHATDVHELSAEGTPLAAHRYFAEVPFQLSLVATGKAPSAVYVRPDASAHMTERAFLRLFPWPRRRAVR